MGTFQQPKANKHFVAHIEIKEVEVTSTSSSPSGKTERTVDDTARIIIKDKSLTALTAKVAKHLELLSEVDTDDLN